MPSCSRPPPSQHEVDHYLDLLDARELADGWTTSADVERTKPEPDLVAAAIERAGGGPAVMVGDSTWDCEAAKRAGVPDDRRADGRLLRAGAASPRAPRACSSGSTICAPSWPRRRSSPV